MLLLQEQLQHAERERAALERLEEQQQQAAWDWESGEQQRLDAEVAAAAQEAEQLLRLSPSSSSSSAGTASSAEGSQQLDYIDSSASAEEKVRASCVQRLFSACVQWLCG